MKILAELTGGADICRRVDDLEALQARAFLREGERVLFALASAKDEFVWTGEAFVVLGGDSAASTKRLVERFDFQSERVAHVAFESCGLADRGSEIKFRIGSEHVSVDIARAEDDAARVYYKVIELLGREQRASERTWEFAKLSLKHTSDALYLTENSGQTLGRQSDEALERCTNRLGMPSGMAPLTRRKPKARNFSMQSSVMVTSLTWCERQPGKSRSKCTFKPFLRY